MAIQNHHELITTLERITRLQLALEEMNTTEAAGDFQRQAEGMMALITGMRSEIDVYLGVVEDVDYEAARKLYLALAKAPPHMRKTIQEMLSVQITVWDPRPSDAGAGRSIRRRWLGA